MKVAKIFGVMFLLSFFPAASWGQDCNRADMNCAGGLAINDAVALIQRIYFDTTVFCDPAKGDLNCDGFLDMADMLLGLNCILDDSHPTPLGPCPIVNVRPALADPRDSIIVESKIVGPGAGPVSLKVWITNKDTLRGIVLLLRQSPVSGSAYAIPDTLTRLTSTLPYAGLTPLSSYGGTPPDSFHIEGFIFFTDSLQYREPPNGLRKPFWEINFEKQSAFCGALQLDSLPIGAPFDHTIQFVDKDGRRVPVNFVKGMISTPAKGDMDANGNLTSSDVVLMLNCAFLGSGSCDLCFADVNCDGVLTSVDVVQELNLVFLGTPLAGCP